MKPGKQSTAGGEHSDHPSAIAGCAVPGRFLLVDRITEIEAGRRARGWFAIPRELPEFSPCLVAEAIGQLAAWAAMAASGFARRPVAALAGEATLGRPALPGQTIDLGIEVESCDHDAVAYGGWARVNGVAVLELSRCVGAMVAIEEFDDPAAAREHWEALRATTPVDPSVCAPAVSPQVVVQDYVAGKHAAGLLHVPAAAPFFADHFPRKPVFPATLLLDAQLRLSERMAGEVAGADRARLGPSRVGDVKMRSFILPGETVALEAEVRSLADGVATIAQTARVNGKRVATAWIEITSREAR